MMCFIFRKPSRQNSFLWRTWSPVENGWWICGGGRNRKRSGEMNLGCRVNTICYCIGGKKENRIYLLGLGAKKHHGP